MLSSVRALTLITVAALALSACDRGSSSRPVANVPNPPIEPPPPADTQLNWDEENWDERNWQ